MVKPKSVTYTWQKRNFPIASKSLKRNLNVSDLLRQKPMSKERQQREKATRKGPKRPKWTRMTKRIWLRKWTIQLRKIPSLKSNWLRPMLLGLICNLQEEDLHLWTWTRPWIPRRTRTKKGKRTKMTLKTMWLNRLTTLLFLHTVPGLTIMPYIPLRNERFRNSLTAKIVASHPKCIWATGISWWIPIDSIPPNTWQARLVVVI